MVWLWRAHDVEDLVAVYEQGVTDQRSVASPRDGFGAHDRGDGICCGGA
ncbi:hypothetical protein [Rhodococcus sp. UFZ-B548]|nr:hypothetical protein [Rhodococcus sp. UFZ-B548]